MKRFGFQIWKSINAETETEAREILSKKLKEGFVDEMQDFEVYDTEEIGDD